MTKIKLLVSYNILKILKCICVYDLQTLNKIVDIIAIHI